MNSIIIVCVLIGIIIYLTVINFLNRKEYTRRENDLLNRIYSENFPEYVDGTIRLQRKPDKPITSKERRNAINKTAEIEADYLEVT